MNIDLILNFGLVILIAYIAAFLIGKRVPSVLSYILVGLILGRSILNFISPEIVELSSLISVVVLALGDKEIPL